MIFKIFLKKNISKRCEDERSQGYKVYGGGLVKIDPENKTVETYGQSGAFGKVSKDDFETVAKCLKKQFPDYEIEVKVSNFIKGWLFWKKKQNINNKLKI